MPLLDSSDAVHVMKTGDHESARHEIFYIKFLIWKNENY